MGEPSGQGEETSPEGLGGHHLLSQADARRPASQVVGDHLDGQPGGVGSEAARGEMVGLQCQRFPVPVGDAAVISVVDEEGQMSTGRGFHPPDDEPHRCGVGITLKGGVAGLRHVGGAVHPVRDGRPVRPGMASMIFRRLWCWRMVME